MRYNVNENHMLQMLDEEEPIGYKVRIYDHEDNEVEVIYVDVDDDIDVVVEQDYDLKGCKWEIIEEVR